jgi:hypothetical protein
MLVLVFHGGEREREREREKKRKKENKVWTVEETT